MNQVEHFCCRCYQYNKEGALPALNLMLKNCNECLDGAATLASA